MADINREDDAIEVASPPRFNMGERVISRTVIRNDGTYNGKDIGEVLVNKGEIGFIISRSFLEADKAQKLRGWLANNVKVREVLDFREAIVFPRVGISPCVGRSAYTPQ